MTAETILDLNGLSKIYGEAIALNEIDLEVKEGSFSPFLVRQDRAKPPRST
ncbi:hypothetical protein [Leucobacter viscericola]|uniref:hypothetical protein n=1 Tax=Leucobacter viscericola TaxID=2714935 RepID=UPI00197F8E91|nr:hypothetical protein [Leucobacter viscericola]